ncbi:tellurite resistance TerB family protein [Flammeovirga agarivorans]|uniref:TerB family tellurite resistance protein n=1 Tax=Flammeovirga agarivorans TaxID=2726742 RepID=A0A7X8SNM0_9BACT|nr:TerB family tellurite resistance protein [Flammeovirga agarivorans]NLR93540.1 TerB family tellurite resistance protein [Flammeovirga agarivorans]
MKNFVTDFDYPEKLSFLKVIEDMIHADCKVDQAELLYLEDFKQQLSLDENCIELAQSLNKKECIKILKNMPTNKKEVVYEKLIEIANIDNEFHPSEEVLILNLCQLIDFKPVALL